MVKKGIKRKEERKKRISAGGRAAGGVQGWLQGRVRTGLYRRVGAKKREVALWQRVVRA